VNRTELPEYSPEHGMDFIVKVIAKFVIRLIVVFGLYVTVSGDRQPGGGFPGGVILACGFVLLVLAFGRDHVSGKFGMVLKSVAYRFKIAAYFVVFFLTMILIFFFIDFERFFSAEGAGFLGSTGQFLVVVSSVLYAAFVAVSLFTGFLVLIASLRSLDYLSERLGAGGVDGDDSGGSP